MDATTADTIRTIEETHGVTIEARRDGRNANLDARRDGRIVAMASVREGLWTWEQALATLTERIVTAHGYRHLDIA